MLDRQNRKAFTLIELLVVVAIIALLVGIMVPSVQQAMDVAIDGVVKTQLKNIGIGLELFKSDRLAGDGYYPTSTTPHMAPKSGAELLCDALMGIDLKGYDPLETYEEGCTRRGPFIKMGTVEFESVPMDYIMKDKWEMPIIYYSARPGVALTSGAIVDFYREGDNKAFIDGYALPSGASNYPGTGGFATYITDLQIPSNDVPYNPDTFILISAGKDKIYGNDDDITNFEKREP